MNKNIEDGFGGASTKYSLLTRFFVWLSTASPDVLSKCSGSELTKQSALGATILIPVFFSFIASGYIVSGLDIPTVIKWLVPIAWAIIVLVLDRALLATYKAKTSQVFFRVVLGFVIAITIAHPVTLSIFKGAIDSRIEEIYKQPKINEIELRVENKLRLGNAEVEELVSDRDKKTDGIEICQALSPPESISQLLIENLRNEKKQLKSNITRVHDKLINLQNKLIDEEEGRGVTKKSGRGPVYHSIEVEIKSKQDEINSASKDIIAVDKEIALVIRKDQIERKEAIDKKRDICDSFYLKEKNNIDNIDLRISRIRDLLTIYVNNSDVEINNIKKEESDTLQQTLALHSLFKDPDKGGFFAQITFYSFIILFILIDTIPILLKFMSKGCYEFYLRLEDMEIAEKYKEYPKLIKETVKKSVADEIDTNYQNRKLDLAASVIQKKHMMLFDFINIRNKYIRYLNANLDVDGEKIKHLTDNGNKKLLELLEADSDKLLESFFSDRRNRD